MRASHRQLLAQPQTSGLLLRSVIARLPLGMYSLAILLLVREHQHGSFLAAGLTVGAFTLGTAATAPFAGALIDRHGQPRVLLPCAIGQAALLAALVLLAGGSLVLLVTIATLAGALTPPLSACVRVLWPTVAEPGSAREALYSLDAITQEIIWVSGPLAVAAVVALANATAAVLLAAAITLIGTTVFLAAELPRSWRAPQQRSRRTSALSSARLRALLGSIVAMGAMIGSLEVGMPALANHLRVHAMAGVLLSMLSVGSILGGLLHGTRNSRRPLAERHALLLATGGITIVPLLFASNIALVLPLSLLAGLCFAPIFSCQYALINDLAPAGSAAEAFAWQSSALIAGISAGCALTGLAVDVLGTHAAFGFGCCAGLAAGSLALLEHRRQSAVPVVAS